jgi:hypothetical protein
LLAVVGQEERQEQMNGSNGSDSQFASIISTGGGRGAYSGNGGSGVVVIKIPDTRTATFSGGVTETNSTAGGYTTYIVTATSNTSQTVTFS